MSILLIKYWNIQNSAESTGLPEKLFKAFQDEVGKAEDVTELMNSWVFEAGYPVIKVEVDSDRKKATISQKRFLRYDSDKDEKTIWQVPINYATNQNLEQFEDTQNIVYLKKEKMEIEFGEKPIDWVVFNVQQTGTNIFTHYLDSNISVQKENVS